MIKKLEERFQHATDRQLWLGFGAYLAILAFKAFLDNYLQGWGPVVIDGFFIVMSGVLLYLFARRKQ